MARAKTKIELNNAAKDNYNKLFNLINSMNLEDQTKEFTYDITKEKETHWKRDKNIRDILIHLYEWHQLLINWINYNIKGETKSFLPEPYNWKTYGDMNIEFFNKHQSTSYEDSKTMLDKSHNEVLKLIENFSNEELFEKNIFTWTGTTTLGSYCISATSSHYDWAIKKVKKHINTLK